MDSEQQEVDNMKQEVDNMRPIKNIKEFYLPCLKCDGGKIKRTVERNEFSGLSCDFEIVKCDKCHTEYIVRISPDLKIEVEERDL